MQRYDDRPQPPKDEELKNFIEKIAEYVGKFGPESELNTQREQQGNPKFDFLFGGPYSDYYKYCVHCYKERESSQMSSFPSHGSSEVDDLRMKINGLRQQIIESERNLKAQLDSQAAFRDIELNKRITAAENEKISNYVSKAQLELNSFKEILDQLKNPKCSKEAIALAKKWIFDHCHHDQQREVILMYLSNRVKDVESTDSFRLNILYLINDWAHQCQRKKLDPVTQVLSRYVPQMYAFSMELATDPNMNAKLEKLAGVWEGHQYFNDHCFKQLRNPTFIYTSSKQALTAEYCQLGINIDAHLQAMYAGYEQQHNNFAQHCLQQIKQLESELEQYHHGPDHSFNLNLSQPPPPIRRSRFDQQSRFDDEGNKINFGRLPFHPPGRMPMPPMKEPFKTTVSVPDGDDIDGHPFNEEDLIPKVDYYSLPAGIIVPLIPMESLTYEPIGVSSLRMPPPVPPSQRLLESMDAFYNPPISEKLRDSQGWEKNALADFFERKLRLKKIFQEKLTGEGRTLGSVMKNKQMETDYKLEREDRETALSRYIESQKSNRDSRSRSRSRSMTRSRSSSASSYRRRRSNSRSRSRSSNSSNRSRKSRSPFRSRSASPSSRVGFARGSPSPPAFTSFAMPTSIGGSNKGALLMQKMGWSGSGLGANETGIMEPVNAGEVRDKSGLYRGLGSRLDPFEQFRKQRSSSYHDRNLMASVERDRTRRD